MDVAKYIHEGQKSKNLPKMVDFCHLFLPTGPLMPPCSLLQKPLLMTTHDAINVQARIEACMMTTTLTTWDGNHPLPLRTFCYKNGSGRRGLINIIF